MILRPRALHVLFLAPFCIDALTLDVGDTGSIKSAASTIAHEMMTYYAGNVSGNAPGLLPPPYYWWEAGAMFGTLIDYWYYTDDVTYNQLVTEGMQFQVGPNRDFMPPNQTKAEGNDDQGFWGIAAMSAAELKFPNPPDDQPQWLALAQAVFNSQALRWEKSTCGGGLRWQIFPFNNGYTYKNAISNGCFFNLASRLGAYTGNQTYFEWANRVWDWTADIGMMSSVYNFWDGSDDLLNCTRFNHVQWSYNAGVFLLGAGVMWNQTTGTVQSAWETHIRGILNMTGNVFFHDNIMFESACEPIGNCNLDQQSFKAYLSRWMAATTKVAPWTYEIVQPYLAASAVAAAKSCSGGTTGNSCGTKWTTGEWDNTAGVGQQMNALEVIQSNLIEFARGPVSGDTGGTSEGDPSAGSGGDVTPGKRLTVITSADQVGAGILTAALVVLTLGGSWFMIS